MKILTDGEIVEQVNLGCLTAEDEYCEKENGKAKRIFLDKKKLFTSSLNMELKGALITMVSSCSSRDVDSNESRDND